MTEFYKEITPNGYGIAIKKKSTLFSEQSEFQKVEIIESDSTLGKFLTLDDLMMCTEGDEFYYHEMISHIPMMHHKSPKSVLVIGGGDGGTVREVLKHKTVEKVVLCEIDGMVIDACKKYLPSMACELDNPKVEIKVEDAIEFIKDKTNEYDVVLIDSTGSTVSEQNAQSTHPAQQLTNIFYMNVKIEQSWKEQLALEFDKEYFKSLTDFVRQEYQSTTVYPPGSYIFNAFEHCPFDKVKVVILGHCSN